MTESEVIEKFKRTSILWESATNTEMVEAVKMAINALEKQIPKKRDNYSCPICSHYFEDGECFTYCPECGQRLE